MIVSHRYRFIFLKTRKTAGTSIEIALSKYLGEHDIATPVDEGDEALRQSLGYRGAQNFKPPFSREALPVVRHPDLMTPGFRNHATALQASTRLGKRIWGSYYKFCFERNPWDRVASYYYWLYKKAPRISMAQFIASGAPHLLREAGWHLYTIDGKIVVDRVCRYETLAQDLEEVRSRLGVPEPLTLPNAKSGLRKPGQGYRELFDDRERRSIGHMFAPEIAQFGYRF